MRILHVITSLRTGGAERLMVDLIPRLQAYGHTVSLLLLDGTKTDFYQQLRSRGIHVYALGHGRAAMHNPLLLFRMQKFLKKHSYDIIHTHNSPCQFLVAAIAHDKSTRYVTTEHNTSNRRQRLGIFLPVDRWMYGTYDHVICVSEAVAQGLQHRVPASMRAQRMTVVANGIDTETFLHAQPSPALLTEYAGKHLLVMVAAFRPQKDQATLIRAMARLSPDYHLLLVGDGERRKACEDLVRQLHLEQRVTFAGLRTDIPEVLAAASVVVLSSHYEGLALSSIEGMASGRPFVACNVPGTYEVVNGAGLLFPHSDDRLLADTLQRCCEDEAFAQEVSARCRQRAQEYDINHMVDGYEHIYRYLLKTL